MEHLDICSVHLPSFLSKKLKLIFIKYTDTVSWKEITYPHCILETVMPSEQLLLATNWFASTAVFIPSFNTDTITVVNTAQKYKLWVWVTVSVQQAFPAGAGEEFFHKKKVSGQLHFLHILPVASTHWTQDPLGSASSHLSAFQVLFQRNSKEPPSTHSVMCLLSISCQLLYSYSIQFLPPLVRVGCFILSIIVYLYPPDFLDLLVHLSFASLIDTITHLLFEGKGYFMHQSVLIG